MAYDDQIMQTPEGWWVLRDDTHLARWVEQAQRLDHDQPVLQKLAPYIKRGSVVYDLGAALGDHTLFYLHAVGPAGAVVAFEPHPLHYECLRRNCPSAICFPYAIGETEDEVWLFNQPEIVAGSRLIDPGLGWPMNLVRRVSLDTKQVVPGHVSFMKIDIEGCEPEALRGAKQTIGRYHPAIWMEINPEALERQGHSTNELRDVIENQLGYRVAEFYPEGGSWDGFDGAQCDALFLPKQPATCQV
jgi:FkbM family methyltransferase